MFARMATKLSGNSLFFQQMQNAPQTSKKSISADWLVRGILTKIGDIFDRLMGRGYKPSSSLATSELIERLKFLMDSEAVEENGRMFVPNFVKLKMQWDKFSTDSAESMRALENEFLVAAIDHINDKRYYTKAPFHVEAKRDYFTKGVKLFVSFDGFSDDDNDRGISVAVPGEKTFEAAAANEPLPERTIIVQFAFGANPFQKELKIRQGERLSVGRTKENHLAIEDPSLSKYHASLALDADGNLLLADTGSTNGTFLNGERIAYGKAVVVTERDKVRFGLVDATFKIAPLPPAATEVSGGAAEIPDTQSYTIGDMEFTTRDETSLPATEPAINVDVGRAAPTIPTSESPKNGDESVAEQPPVTVSSIELNKEDEIEIP
jgi:pSer/pThr/pTyr-binding forkhead associated (FHA) protein